MNGISGLSKWKAALYLAGIFAAGGVSGWVVATKAAKQKAFSPPRAEEIAASMRTCMYDRLKLTSEQKQRLDAVIERCSKEIQALHRDRTDRIRAALSNRNTQIMAVLNPEQQIQFEQIEKERQEAWRQKDASRNRHNGERDGRKSSKDKDKDKASKPAVSSTNAAPEETNAGWITLPNTAPGTNP